MRIVLVRHGQTEWNEKQVFRGRADIPLDETGIRQAQAAAERLADFKIERIYSSRLKRTWETAQIIAKRSGITPEMENALIDIDFGDWEGMAHEDVKNQFPELFRKWIEAPQTARIPNGEDLGLVKKRVDGFLDTVRHSMDDTIGIVSHRVVLKVFVCCVLDLDLSYFWRIRMDVGSVSILDHNDGRFAASVLNDTCHLKENKNLGDF